MRSSDERHSIPGADPLRFATPSETRPSETIISRGTSQTLFVPDTPLKPREPFARTQSLPSFAALGAAFRPGSTDPFQEAGLPPPPVLPGDEDDDGREWRGTASAAPGAMGTPVKPNKGWVVPDT